VAGASLVQALAGDGDGESRAIVARYVTWARQATRLMSSIIAGDFCLADAGPWRRAGCRLFGKLREILLALAILAAATLLICGDRTALKRLTR